jgi:uncharacterized protein (TIGR02453 family)
VSPRRETIDVARTLRFLRQLEKHNDRPWFAAHRDVWDEHVKPEWEDTVAALLATATAFDERFAYVDPRTCLFRLYRDTRFSKDKTPYKTWISAWMSPFGKHGSNPGFYVQLSPGECMVSAGIWDPTKEALHALRRHFADASLRDFDKMLSSKRLAAYLPLRTDPLRVTPRGFPKDHPRRDLIRARRCTVRRIIPDAALGKAGAFTTFRAAMRDLAPFVAYLERIVASSHPEQCHPELVEGPP